MISTRTSANGCLNARRTFSPAGRYRRPAAISARRKSPMAAMRSATGASADAQPASTTSLRSRPVTGSHSSRAYFPLPVPAPGRPSKIADGRRYLLVGAGLMLEDEVARIRGGSLVASAAQHRTDLAGDLNIFPGGDHERSDRCASITDLRVGWTATGRVAF